MSCACRLFVPPATRITRSAPVLAVIDPVARAEVDPAFGHALAHRPKGLILEDVRYSIGLGLVHTRIKTRQPDLFAWNTTSVDNTDANTSPAEGNLDLRSIW